MTKEADLETETTGTTLPTLTAHIDRVEAVLSAKETAREAVLKHCRSLRRAATAIINAMHTPSAPDSASSPDFEPLEAMVETLHSLVGEHTELLHRGYTENAMQEYCEARIFSALITATPPPSADELGVTSESYLLGLADVVGELRRCVLDRLVAQDTRRARELYVMMEGVYELLQRFDLPSAMVPVRKKRDIARAIVERTHADLAVAVQNIRLEEALRAAHERVGEE